MLKLESGNCGFRGSSSLSQNSNTCFSGLCQVNPHQRKLVLRLFFTLKTHQTKVHLMWLSSIHKQWKGGPKECQKSERDKIVSLSWPLSASELATFAFWFCVSPAVSTSSTGQEFILQKVRLKVLKLQNEKQCGWRVKWCLQQKPAVYKLQPPPPPPCLPECDTVEISFTLSNDLW